MAKKRNVGAGQGVGGGRPLKFESVEKLQEAIDAYFLSCYDYSRDMFGNRLHDKEHPKYVKPSGRGKNRKPGNPVYVMKKVKAFTITGLALALDTTRDTLLDYESGKYDDKDADGNDLALTEAEQAVNAQIDKFSDTIKRAKMICYDDTEQYLFKPGTATGAKFSLMNNYHWKDETTVKTEPLRPNNPFGNLDENTLRRLAAEEPESE